MTADQVSVFVRLEIRQTHDDGLRCESSGNRAHALGQLVDEELDRVRVAGHLFVHCGFRVCIELVVFKQCLWMYADHSIDDEFEPRKPDAVVRYVGEVEGTIGIANIEHYLDRNFRQ